MFENVSLADIYSHAASLIKAYGYGYEGYVSGALDYCKSLEWLAVDGDVAWDDAEMTAILMYEVEPLCDYDADRAQAIAHVYAAAYNVPTRKMVDRARALKEVMNDA